MGRCGGGAEKGGHEGEGGEPEWAGGVGAEKCDEQGDEPPVAASPNGILPPAQQAIHRPERFRRSESQRRGTQQRRFAVKRRKAAEAAEDDQVTLRDMWWCLGSGDRIQ